MTTDWWRPQSGVPPLHVSFLTIFPVGNDIYQIQIKMLMEANVVEPINNFTQCSQITNVIFNEVS